MILLYAMSIATLIAHPARAQERRDADERPARQLSREELASVLSSFEHEPSVREVQRAALRHAGLEADATKSWPRRARLANLIPELEGEVAWLDERDAQRRYEEEIAATDSGTLRRDQLDSRYDDEDRLRRIYSVEAELELGGLVFDSDEVSAARELRQQQAARRKLVAAVTDLYFERRKKQVLRLVAERSWRARLDLILSIEQLTARLDGLTGGWFRRQVDSNRSLDSPGLR